MVLWMKGLALHKLGHHEEAVIILKDADGIYNVYNKELSEDIQEIEKAFTSQNNYI